MGRFFIKRNCIIAIFLLLMIAIFTVPYLIPPNVVVTSMSYDYQFNNKVGVILTYMSIFVFVALGYVNKCRIIEFFNKNRKGTSDSYRYIWIGGLIVVIYTIIMGITCGYRLAFYAGESTYFIPHIFDLVNGYAAYDDFLFNYGPLMIYFPYWVYIISFESSVLWAYLFSIILFHLLGLFMFNELLTAMNFDCKTKKWIFWSVYICFFPVALGMNYEMLRFVLPFWCFFRLHHNATKWRMLFFPLSVLLCLAISPEIGLVYLIALLIYCCLQYYAFRDSIYISLAVMSFMLTICFMVIYQPMFSMLLSFSSGLLNFPFMPSWHLILFFSAIMLLAYIMGGKIREIKYNVFELSFVIMAFGLLPASLGRCDPGHVVYNGLFILIAALVIILLKWPEHKKLLAAVSVISLFLINGWGIVNYGRITATNIAVNALETSCEAKKQISNMMALFHFDDAKIAKFEHLADSLYEASRKNVIPGFIPTKDRVAMPLGGDNRLMDALARDSRLEPLYVKRMDLSGDSKNVYITIKELEEKKPSYLLLEKKWEKIVEPTDNSLNVKLLFMTYYPFAPQKNGNLVYQPLVEYININYHIEGGDNRLLLYKRNKE